MPLYEFKCRQCDHQFERQMAWKEPFPACPACASDNVRKVFHPAALVFKGSGWHVNDYASNGSKKTSATNGTNGSGESAPAKAETPAPAKTESSSAKSDA